MLNNMTSKKNVIVLLLILLSVVTYIVLTTKDHQGKIGVVIDVVPADARITIDTKQYKTGTEYFKKGSYRVEVKKDGFIPYVEDMYFDETRRNITVSLYPESSEAKKWAEEHQDEYDRLFKIGQKFATGAGSGVSENNPILEKLPYRTFTYTIGYIGDPNDPSGNSIILTIHARDGYRLAALYKIRELGYDPTDFNITFKDYENPFPL